MQALCKGEKVVYWNTQHREKMKPFSEGLTRIPAVDLWWTPFWRSCHPRGGRTPSPLPAVEPAGCPGRAALMFNSSWSPAGWAEVLLLATASENTNTKLHLKQEVQIFFFFFCYSFLNPGLITWSYLENFFWPADERLLSSRKKTGTQMKCIRYTINSPEHIKESTWFQLNSASKQDYTCNTKDILMACAHKPL